jgi:hypothetical protein
MRSSSAPITAPWPTFTRSLWKEYVSFLGDDGLKPNWHCEQDDTTYRMDKLNLNAEHPVQVSKPTNIRLRVVAACVQTVLRHIPGLNSVTYFIATFMACSCDGIAVC